jgi:hypothetical protein
MPVVVGRQCRFGRGCRLALLPNRASETPDRDLHIRVAEIAAEKHHDGLRIAPLWLLSRMGAAATEQTEANA